MNSSNSLRGYAPYVPGEIEVTNNLFSNENNTDSLLAFAETSAQVDYTQNSLNIALLRQSYSEGMGKVFRR